MRLAERDYKAVASCTQGHKLESRFSVAYTFFSIFSIAILHIEVLYTNNLSIKDTLWGPFSLTHISTFNL